MGILGFGFAECQPEPPRSVPIPCGANHGERHPGRESTRGPSALYCRPLGGGREAEENRPERYDVLPDNPETQEAPSAPPQRKGPGTLVLVGTIAGGILLVAFAAALFRGGSPFTGGLSGGRGTSPLRSYPGSARLVSPAGSIPRGEIVLHWEPAEGIQEYEAILLDNQGTQLWRSGRVSGDRVAVPESSARYVVPGAAHFWTVIGYRPDGTEVPSTSAQFTVAP